MIYSRIRSTIAVTVFTLLALIGCGKSGGSDSDILQFVPAETPYYFAILEQLPSDMAEAIAVMDEWNMADSFNTLKVSMAAEMSLNGEAAIDASEYEALLDELESLFSSEGLADAGINIYARRAFYDVMSSPVLRLELDSRAKAEAKLADIQAKSDGLIEDGTIDGQAYKYVNLFEQFRIALFVSDDHLVLSALKADAPDQLIKQVFGLELPSESLAQTNRVDSLKSEFGYTDYGLGELDTLRLVELFLQPEVEGALFAGQLNSVLGSMDVCRDELRGLSKVMPRLVSGFTEVDDDKVVGNALLELRDDIAEPLSKITSPVPGIGQDSGDLMALGFSINLMALREFMSQQAEAIEASPYECPFLADMNAISASMRGSLMQMQSLPPMAYDLKGFYAVIDGIDTEALLTESMPQEADMRFMLAMDEVESLLAMGSMYVPGLSSMDIENDGVPVPFDLMGMLPIPLESPHIAMTDNALALSVGEGMEEGLQDMVTATAAGNSPLLHVSMDAAEYFGMLSEFNETSMDAMAQMGMSQAGMDEEFTQAQAERLKLISELFGQMIIDISPNSDGMEMEFEFNLKD